MKTAQAKSTPASTRFQTKKDSQPFFQKRADESALASEQTQTPFFSKSPVIQTKLTIGQPGDKYEQEADQTKTLAPGNEQNGHSEKESNGNAMLPPDFAVTASAGAPPAAPPATPVQMKPVAQMDNGKDGEKDKGGEFKGDVDASLPRNQLEYNYEFAKKGNLSGSMRINLSPKKNKIVSGEVGYKEKHEDMTDAKPNVKAKAGLGETKFTLKKSPGQKVGAEMATALAKVDVLEVSPFNWLKVTMDVKGFEAKMKANAEAGKEFEVALAKISGNIKGSPPPDWLESIGVPKEIIDNYSFSISGKIEYKVPFEDLAKLRKMHNATRTVTKETAEMAKKIKAKDLLETENKANNKKLQELYKKRKQLRKRGKSRGKPPKKLKDIQKQIDKLTKKTAENRKKIDSLRKGISKHKGIISKADDVARAAYKGLKSKAGRFIGKGIQKAGAKIAGKIIAKLIPGLNIISTIVDVIELGIILYKVFDGQIEFGLGGGEGGKGEGGEGGGTGEGGQSGPGGKEGGESGTGGEGGQSQTDKGGQGGDSEKGGPQPGTGGDSAVPDFDQVDINDPSLYEEVKDPFEQEGTPPELSPAAKKVIEALKPSGDAEGATPLTNEQLRALNDVIPQDLTEEQLNELIRQLSSGSETAKGMPADKLIGKVMDTVDKVKTGRTDEEKISEVKEVEYDAAGKANLSWQSKIGWTVSELGGNSAWTPTSKEFIDYIAGFQANNGINGGGIAGPVTTIAILESLGKTNSPTYEKAKAALEVKASEDRKAGKKGDGSGKGPGEGGEKTGEGGDKSGKGGDSKTGGDGTTDGKTPAKDEKDKKPPMEEGDKKSPDAADKGGDKDKGTDKEMPGGEEVKEVNNRPPVFNQGVLIDLLKYDKDTKTVSVNQENIDKLKGFESLQDGYGMEMNLGNINVSVKPIKVGDSVKYFQVQDSMSFTVTKNPGNAGESYPYEVGQTYTEGHNLLYDIETDKFMPITQFKFGRILSGMLVDGGSEVKFKSGIVGTEQDLGELDATIQGIASQHAYPQAGGKNAYVVHVNVVPTKLKSIHGLMNGDSYVELKVGEQVTLKTVLMPQEQKAE